IHLHGLSCATPGCVHLFFFQAEDGIRDFHVTGVQTCALPIYNSSAERKAAMTAYGAELILVSKEEGMEGARDLALKMQAEGRGKVLDQFANGDNPEAHYSSTGPELWQQTGGSITHFVSSMGTTGTI